MKILLSSIFEFRLPSRRLQRPRRGTVRVLPVVALVLLCLSASAWWAAGRGYKTRLVGLVRPGKNASASAALRQPALKASRPGDGEENVVPESPITVELDMPNGRIDAATLTADSVALAGAEDGMPVPAALTVSTGGGSVHVRPLAPLAPCTAYTLRVGAGLKDVSGVSVKPFTVCFGTAAAAAAADPAVRFEKVKLPGTAGEGYTCVAVGPDHKLYASSDDGRLFRWPLLADGTLGVRETIKSLQTANHGKRLIAGFCFDPAAPADAPVLWVTHSYFAFENAPDFTGKIARISGPALDVVEDVVVNLPRSYRDHLTNQPSFGPDGALYFPQGCSSAYGAPDSTWGNREEHLLTATVLRLDVTRVTPGQPLDARTADVGGAYDPFAPGAPLTIYATGIRNAFDLVWHSNGHLYVPTNGSSPGGNTPAGNGVPALSNLAVSEDDWLFDARPGRYYGHPNPVQKHFVLNGGNPSGSSGPLGKPGYVGLVPQYPPGTLPDRDWEPAAYVFGKHVSANGVIEYRGNAFRGKLDRCLLVCRYNVGSDVLALKLDAAGKVTGAIAGIPGLTNFVNPLDLAEDVQSGCIYLAEYGGRRITLLRPGKER